MESNFIEDSSFFEKDKKSFMCSGDITGKALETICALLGTMSAKHIKEIKTNFTFACRSAKCKQEEALFDVLLQGDIEQIILGGLGDKGTKESDEKHAEKQIKEQPVGVQEEKPRIRLATGALTISLRNKLGWEQGKRTFYSTLMKAGVGKELYFSFMTMARVTKALKRTMGALKHLVNNQASYASTPKMIRLFLLDLYCYTLIMTKTMSFMVRRLRLIRFLDAAIIESAAKVKAKEVLRKDEMALVDFVPELKNIALAGTESPSNVQFDPVVLFNLSVCKRTFKLATNWLIYGIKILRMVLKEVKLATRMLKRCGLSEEEKTKRKGGKEHKAGAKEVLDKYYDQGGGALQGEGGMLVGEGDGLLSGNGESDAIPFDKDIDYYNLTGGLTEMDKRVAKKTISNIQMTTRYVGQFFNEMATGLNTKTVETYGFKLDHPADFSTFNGEAQGIESAAADILMNDL